MYILSMAGGAFLGDHVLRTFADNAHYIKIGVQCDIVGNKSAPGGSRSLRLLGPTSTQNLLNSILRVSGSEAIKLPEALSHPSFRRELL